RTIFSSTLRFESTAERAPLVCVWVSAETSEEVIFFILKCGFGNAEENRSSYSSLACVLPTCEPGGWELDVRLFVAQRVHGVEAGGLDRRIHSEEQAHAYGDQHAGHHRPHRHGSGQRGENKTNQQADAKADEHANDSARACQGYGFGQ